MKIVKPTFESLLEEIDEIYVRYENIDGVRALVAGGINRNGMWLEFPSRLSERANVSHITDCLKVIVYLVQEKRKQWHLEDSYHARIREMGTNLN